jgi:AcrR family transcriptional regulator
MPETEQDAEFRHHEGRPRMRVGEPVVAFSRLTASGANKRGSNSKRQRLLEACIDVVGELGYRQAKVSDICKAAGVTLRDFYQCFSGKDRCFAASFRFKGNILVDRANQTLADASGPLERRVQSALEVVLGELADDARVAQFVAEAANAGETGEESIDGMIAHARRSRLPDQLPGSDPRSLEQEVLLTAIAGAVTHTIIAWVRRGRAAELREVAPCLSRYVSGILREGPPPVA